MQIGRESRVNTGFNFVPGIPIMRDRNGYRSPRIYRVWCICMRSSLPEEDAY